jgi:two-component SAPR family response regulator
VLSAKQRIAQAVTTVFELHARCRERDGHPDEARLWYERALQIDDRREDLHRGLMRVRQTSGRDA